MASKYDIGVVGCWYWGNYGSLLNGYATYLILKELGMKPLNIVTPNNGFEPHAKKFFDEVYSKEDISETLSFDRVREFNNICDSFLTGSDQIWHNDPVKKNREYDYFFHLDFAEEYKKKISFATSLGAIIPEKNHYYSNIKKLLYRYDAISLREKSAVEYLQKAYGIAAAHIIEPVFITPKKIWCNIAEKSHIKNEGKYILSYILDPNDSKRKLIKDCSKQLEMKSINILDGFSGAYERNLNLLNLDNTLSNVWAGDLLKCLMESEFVITDSFHGACFAIIFNKPFLVLANYGRGIERLNSILEDFQLQERLIDINKIDYINYDSLFNKVDYNYTNSEIDKKGEQGINWLKQAIEKPVSPIKKNCSARCSINNVLDSDSCMGCGACVSKCPVEAIKLKEDEMGVYRSYVDSNICIKCGKCIDVCAALELPQNINTNNPAAYAFVNSDEAIVKDSSSGGAFTAIAETVLEKGGCVVGAAWNEYFRIEHIIIEKKEDLQKLRKSKYFQSFTGKIFKDVKEKLDENRIVLFTGTPCQVTGLKKYLGKGYSNLYLVDVLCANCPSSKFFAQYFDEINNDKNIVEYNFRYKKDSNEVWDAKAISIKKKDGKYSVYDIDEDSYLKMYHTCSWGLASQCMKCQYQGNQRVGDLTIGDCWGIENYDPLVEHKYGVSAVLINNEKGKDLVDLINPSKIKIWKKESLEEIKKYNRLAFLNERDWKRSYRSEYFIDKIKDEKFSVATALTSSLKIECVYDLMIDSITKEKIDLSWKVKDDIHYNGLIIEEFTDNEWKRIAKIDNKTTRICSITNINGSVIHELRVKAFYYDGSIALYSEYDYIRNEVNRGKL